MELNPVGDELEAVCCGCGEALLISSGDTVNFRAGDTMNVMGIEVPMPAGLLCARCNREENGRESLSVKFTKMVCSSCGSELSPDNIEPEFGEDGDIKGMICFDCFEPWRRSLCQED
jgi:hypothetical protein